MSTELEIKQEICEMCRRLWVKGFVAGNDGNISYRLGDGRFLCTPTGVSKGFLTPDDIAVVDGEGKQLSGDKPRTSEILLHLEFFHEVPDINAVCHAHPPHATAFAVAGIPLPSGIMPEMEIHIGQVPFAPYETPGGKEFAETILPHLKNKCRTILLGNHGAVSAEKTVELAYFRHETIDMYCHILLLAKQIGSVQQMSDRQIRDLLEIRQRMGMDDPRLSDLDGDIRGDDEFLRRI